MTVLELSFPAGRYHATPWGRHVNEGAVEWPPAPWRIVRALIATWYLKAREIPKDTMRSLVNALSQQPSFRLPRASTSHTRHYLPFNEGKTKRPRRFSIPSSNSRRRRPCLSPGIPNYRRTKPKRCTFSPTDSATLAAPKVSWRCVCSMGTRTLLPMLRLCQKAPRCRKNRTRPPTRADASRRLRRLAE